MTDFADKSIDDLEKIGDKTQKERGYPKAYYTTAHVWLDQTYPEDEDIDYELRGYTNYTTQYEPDLNVIKLVKMRMGLINTWIAFVILKKNLI